MQESQIASLQTIVDEGFKEKDGPFVRGLETAMRCSAASILFWLFHWKPCASHTSSMRNYTYLTDTQPKNLDILFKSLKDIVSKQEDSGVKQQACAVSEKFKRIFTLVWNCHKYWLKLFLLVVAINNTKSSVFLPLCR